MAQRVFFLNRLREGVDPAQDPASSAAIQAFFEQRSGFVAEHVALHGTVIE
jgi:hypothetical protein